MKLSEMGRIAQISQRPPARPHRDRQSARPNSAGWVSLHRGKTRAHSGNAQNRTSSVPILKYRMPGSKQQPGGLSVLMERQDRMNEEIFFKLNDLGYRQDDLEEIVDDLKQKERSG